MKDIVPKFVVQDGYLHMVSHGGVCCGMTQIYGFPPYNPLQPVREHPKMTSAQIAERIKNNPWFSRTIEVPTPEGTLLDRLKALLYHKINERPSGIIEVVLADYQMDCWKDALEELGFKLVNSHVNSNSRRTLNVFHLNTTRDMLKGLKPKKIKAEAKEPQPQPLPGEFVVLE